MGPLIAQVDCGTAENLILSITTFKVEFENYAAFKNDISSKTTRIVFFCYRLFPNGFGLLPLSFFLIRHAVSFGVVVSVVKTATADVIIQTCLERRTRNELQ